MRNKFKRKCSKCKEEFDYDDRDTFFDEKGYGYSTKLVKCKNCNCINILNHYEDKSLNLNYDERYYNYR